MTSPRSPSSAPFSWTGLLQSLFEAEDGDSAVLGSVASPLTAVLAPRWTRRSRNSNSATSPASPASPASSSGQNDEETTLPYSPSRLDGEFNVWFARKPLGLGLVPSTQLYGTWEISSIATVPANAPPDEAHERRKIRRGDVIIAVNYSARNARLPREDFAAFLTKSACPIVVTLRRPALYGSLDSRALSTAMFPASIEYRGRDHDADSKTFLSRASSMQWKRSLQHELSVKKTGANTTNPKMRSKSHRLPQEQEQDERLEPTPEVDPAASSSSSSLELSAVQPVTTDPRPRAQSSAQLTEMGEYTFVFHEVPLSLKLAPSTRLYGSVEVYDPKSFSPVVQIGDVVLAVNGDSAVAKWPTDDAIDHIETLTPPVSITFRRPRAYRKYLHTYFTASHATVSSKSVATAMFPASAEYKHGHHYQKAKTKQQEKTRRNSGKDATRVPEKTTAALKATRAGEWQRISSELAATDQFKPWQSHSTTVNANTKANAFGMSAASSATASWLTTSAFLTERHVHFLWDHLPEYLTCNDMELAYDTRRHGWNLLSFYALVEDKGPTLLVIKDTRDQIFGAFSSTSWKQSSGVYGNGRCFVFTLRPQMQVFEWSGLDHTFMYGQRDALMMGGGKKGIALCVQLDELRGFSHACDTFDSPPLAPSSGGDGSGTFDIENMEVWCFSGLRV